MPISPARTTAFDLLQLVESGGYAADLLHFRTAHLDVRDAGLAHEIVFGVLRYRAQLDYLAAHYAGRPRKLDPEVRTALRMGIYQLRYLERIPAHAAVTETVQLVKRARKTSAAGFVNAILRQVDRDPVDWPDRATALSMPQWLLDRWDSRYGAETAEGIARAALVEPEKFVRIAAAGERRQDIGAQCIVPLLELRPGHRFLDLCAAPGNKTAQALEAGVHVVACDLHLQRLAPLKTLTPNLVALDGTVALPFSAPFDRILVDAPCSGTGTLARNPEIKWRLMPGDLAALHRRQTALLANARQLLAPGGILVYSTCSLEREENEDVAGDAALLRLPGRDAGDGFYAAVIKSS